jgi:hypothetical protein
MRKIFFAIIASFPIIGFTQTFNFSFDSSNENWESFFSDYEVGEEEFYELEFVYAKLPIPLDTSESALKISGNNHSDDLLMCIYRKFDGLIPNTVYAVTFNIDVASNAEKDGFGIGGSPDLMLGAGGVNYLPKNSVDYLSHYRPNFPCSIQAELPNDIIDTLGKIGVSGQIPIDFKIINRNNLTHSILLKTNSNGEIWLLILTDSSFEGITTLYYDNIEVTFTLTSDLIENISKDLISIFPNPAVDNIQLTNLEYHTGNKFLIRDIFGQKVYENSIESTDIYLNISEYKKGIYFIIIENDVGNSIVRKIIIK